jgi:23S rRNA pseudouridine955/2504/2580 synthase
MVATVECAPMTDPAPAGVRKLEVDDGHAGQRLDNFLMTALKGVPRTLVYRILRTGEVRLNGRRAKPSDRIQAGDLVRVPPVRTAAPADPATPGAGLARALGEAVLYEDDHLLVINKPAGLAVHGGSGLSLGAIEALRALRPELRFLELVHRLDRETSGCLVLAKKRSALTHLQRQWREEEDEPGAGVEKIYQALVKGRWKGRQHRIEAPLARDELQGGERMVRVSRDGKPAVTLFEVMERHAGCSLVEVTLLTGRTHQIRVHCVHAGHPIAGDPKYGDDDFNRQMRARGLKRMFLHAAHITFLHPAEGTTLRLSAPLDPALQSLLVKLRAEDGEAEA